MKLVRTFKCYNAWASRCKECCKLHAKQSDWTAI